MVNGIQVFKAAFKDFTDQFIIIGGAACDSIMSDAGLEFRVTKDLDIVLIIEVIESDFFLIFWDFVEKAGYKNREKIDGKKEFYRFTKPKNDSYPYMIELFSRNLDNISLPDKSILTPIPTEEKVASLSAILLDQDYYDFILSHRILIDGFPYVGAECLIPLKAKAWMDLTDKRKDGKNIHSSDIKKHKNDIVRLSQLLTAGESLTLSLPIKEDMNIFYKRYLSSDISPEQLKVPLEKEKVFQRINEFYQLDY